MDVQILCILEQCLMAAIGDRMGRSQPSAANTTPLSRPWSARWRASRSAEEQGAIAHLHCSPPRAGIRDRCGAVGETTAGEGAHEPLEKLRSHEHFGPDGQVAGTGATVSLPSDEDTHQDALAHLTNELKRPHVCRDLRVCH